MSKSAHVDWNNYLREVCVWNIEIDNKEIGGPNLIVEIDESLFVRRKKQCKSHTSLTVGIWRHLQRN